MIYVIISPRGTSPSALPARRMIESGRYSSLTELADAEKINRSYLCRILRLTLLAPDVVEAIVEGRHEGQLAEVMGPVPVEWERQRELMGPKQADEPDVSDSEPASPNVC